LPHHLSKRFGFSLLQMRPFDIIQSEIGSSEKAVRHFFQRAQRNAPCILFIDEFTSIFSKQQPGITNVLIACVDELRTWNLHADTHATVLVIGATRTPSIVPSSCYLPGRFEHRITLGSMPPDGRRRFFAAALHANKNGIDGICSHGIDEIVETLFQSTEGFTPGELQLLLRRVERRKRRFPDDTGELGEYAQLMLEEANPISRKQYLSTS
jgi:transitional endoplasmic reticulum ATPase